VDVSRETLPLDVTLVIDTSGSIHPGLLSSLVAAVNKVRERLGRADRVALLTFDRRIREQVALTQATTLKRIRIDTASGATALNDAIAVALAQPPDLDRRQMAIVFTDGFDTVSFLSEDAVLDVARRSRAALFMVAPVSSVDSTGAPSTGRTTTPPVAFFERLADTTGGMLQVVPQVPLLSMTREERIYRLRVGGSEDILNAPFLRALEDFRTSYVVRYTPEDVDPAGWHELDVRVAGGRYQVRARRGYTGRSPDAGAR
jgi:hypothetical protein